MTERKANRLLPQTTFFFNLINTEKCLTVNISSFTLYQQKPFISPTWPERNVSLSQLVPVKLISSRGYVAVNAAKLTCPTSKGSVI